MPTYRCEGAVFYDGVRYEHGELLTIPDGPVRDDLLSVGAIYRPDLPPHGPREWFFDNIWLPAERKEYPGQPEAIGYWSHSVAGRYVKWATNEEHFAHVERCRNSNYRREYFVPIDEWAIPDNQWPWRGPWVWFPASLKPARGFRPMP